MAKEPDEAYSRFSYVRILERAFLIHAEKTGLNINRLVQQAKADPYLFQRLVADFDWDELSQDFYDDYRSGLRKEYAQVFDSESLRLGLKRTRAHANKYENFYLSTQGSQLVVAVTDNTKWWLSSRAEDGILEGLSPYKTAERMKTGIDILPQHQVAVDKMRAKLIADGIGTQQRNRILKGYHQKLLTYRARNIARTETLNARNQAQIDSWQEGVKQGEIPPTATKTWITAPDERRCPICSYLQGQKVSLHQSFIGPSGEKYRRPVAHPSCRCAMGLTDI